MPFMPLFVFFSIIHNLWFKYVFSTGCALEPGFAVLIRNSCSCLCAVTIMQQDWFCSYALELCSSSRFSYLKVYFKPGIREHIGKWNAKPMLIDLNGVVTGIFLGFISTVVLHLFITIQQFLKCQFLIVLNVAAVVIIKDLKNVLVSQVKHVKFIYKPLNVILS